MVRRGTLHGIMKGAGRRDGKALGRCVYTIRRYGRGHNRTEGGIRVLGELHSGWVFGIKGIRCYAENSPVTKLEIKPKVGNTYDPLEYVLTIPLQFLMYNILYYEFFGPDFANLSGGESLMLHEGIF